MVLVAGGSGASFTVGVALGLIRRWEEDYGGREVGRRKVDFVWVVRDFGEYLLSSLFLGLFLASDGVARRECGRAREGKKDA